MLAKINRSVGTRAETNRAAATYELPPDAVGEAIINAIAHRDYHSNASVEVRLFVDRLEVWNPGSLPGTLTLDDLSRDHPSVPNNPLIAEPLYLARYIERVGSGTQAMIDLCREAGLPAPTFEQRSGSFVVTLWRDWLTDEVMDELGLNERQVKGVSIVKRGGKLTNKIYREAFRISDRTALRDLNELIDKGVLERIGKTGHQTYYIIKIPARHEPDITEI